jgi:phosphoribosylglycinamide formyltransferase 1
MRKQRIAIFASGSGSNAEKIIKHFTDHPSIEVALVLTNNPKAYVIERAKSLDVRSVIFSRDQFKDASFLKVLSDYEITHIVLAGFLWLIPDYLIQNYPDRIINIHPALLPKYGGKGMYGAKVHEAVKAAAESETGITIHLVNEHYDEGRTLFQASCRITSDYSPEQIAECVHALEHQYYPQVIEDWISGKL